MAYVLPQVKVFQEFRVVPTTVVRNLNAFVFGPNYQLFRYAQAAEKELIGLGAYDKDNDVTYAYPNRPAGMAVDQNYVKLYMETIWAQYAAIAAGAATELVAVSATEMNKLRAAPLIGQAVEGGSSIAGVEMSSGGYLTRGVETVEKYYLWPYGGWDSGASAWSADELVMDASSAAQEGKLKYVTTSGLKGTVDVEGQTMPYWINGPHGMRLELATGVDDELHAPIVCTISDGGANYVRLTIDEDYIKTIIDWSVDLNKQLSLIIDLTAGSNGVSWSSANKTLTINSDGGGTPYVLATLKTDLEAISDVATYFDIDASAATPSGSVADAEDQDGNSLDGATTPVVRDCYRVTVNPNLYVFKTANSVNRSAQFYTRDVQVGDRLRYQVTDGGSVVRTGETKIVGLEADYSVPVVADADPKSTNAATQVGSDLATGEAIVVADSGNDRAFNGANTKLFSLDAVLTEFPGSSVDGVIADTYTLTVTKGGAKGTAEVSVINDSGTYSRVGVLIENSGADDGAVYIGNNLKVNFDQGGSDPDAIFQVGDVYTFSADVETPFTALTAADVVAGGVYTGPKNTRYVVEVTRGGVFDRTVNTTEGLAVPATANLTASVNWDDWLGGDINDEYILRCVSAGDIVTAEFNLTSQRGDDQSGITFGAATTDIALGAKGLMAQLSADDTFDVGDYWVIRVNGCRPQVRISDTAGIDDGGYATVNDGEVIDLGNYGAEITFSANLNTEGGFAANGGLLKGDVFYVLASAENATAVRTLVLADDLPATVVSGLDSSTGDSNNTPSQFASWLYLVQSSASVGSKRVQSPPDYNWEADEDELTVYQDLQVQDASWTDLSGEMLWMDVYRATMYVEYRALLTTYADTIRLISDIGDVETTFGQLTPDNPLAQGVYNALSNSGDRGVYYMAVPTDDLAGYGRVLDAASLTDVVYAFAPTTRDRQTLNSVEAHINAMSSEENKRWRIGFFGAVMSTEDAVYDLLNNPAGDEFYATVEDDPSEAGDQYTLLRFVDADGDPSPYTQALTDLRVGDKIRINFASDPWGDETYATYTIAELVSNTAVKLTVSLTAPLTVPTKVEAWHPYSVAEMANAVAAQSSGYRNRRIYCVFPTQLGAYGVIQTAEFAACAVAGLCSAVVPQQGLTNIEVNGFDDLPMVYSTFSRAQLNTMAENGTMILMQDVAGGMVYVRHQVSTATPDGNINTTELSITKNLDSISYYFAGRLQPFIGRYNITPELLDVLETQINDGLMYLGSFTKVGLLGPQLILDGTSLRTLQQHPTLLDHIIAIVDLRLPYPLNVIELHLVV